MTLHPMVTRDSMLATDALNTMVTRGFRHLPVCSDEGDVVGLLDIAKVCYEALKKLERACASSQKLYNALEETQHEWGTQTVGTQNDMRGYIESMRERMTLPDLSLCLDDETVPCTVSVRTSVLEAARMMAEYQTTAVLVIDGSLPSADISGFASGGADGPRLAGIFTSKDVVLRVVAAGLDPRTCSVVRVMTPRPDTAPPTMSIQEALRKMHDGHFLNLPVVDEAVGVVGVVDVLRLTWKTLEMITSMQEEGTQDGGDPVEASGGPLWNHFWNSFGGGSSVYTGSHTGDFMGDGGSFLSSGLQQSLEGEFESLDIPEGASSSDVFPNDSASAVAAAQALEEAQEEIPQDALTHDSNSKVGGAVPEELMGSDGMLAEDDGEYLFKLITPSKRAHRFQAKYHNLDTVRSMVETRLAGDEFFTTASHAQTPSAPCPQDFKLGYEDDDSDKVIMTTDDDLVEAVRLAQRLGRDRVTLILFGGPSWAAPADLRPSHEKGPETCALLPPLNSAPGPAADEGSREQGNPDQAVSVSEADDDSGDSDLACTPRRSRPDHKRKDKGAHCNPSGARGGIKWNRDLALPAAIGFFGVAALVAVVVARQSSHQPT